MISIFSLIKATYLQLLIVTVFTFRIHNTKIAFPKAVHFDKIKAYAFINKDIIVDKKETFQPFNFMIPSAESVGLKAFNLVSNLAESTVVSPLKNVNENQRNLPITMALQRIQANMDMLDNVVGRTPQLGRIELTILVSTVLVSALSPFFFTVNIVEVLVPSMAAVSASIGLSAEYVGKVEVSKSKEISALAIQAAAESEVLLAAAERTKAILPLCVGIATTSSAFALLAPSFLKTISKLNNLQVMTELLLIWPLIAVLAAAIAGLATQECKSIARRASDLGSRRFASADTVGRTWLSITEQVEMNASRLNQKWITFAISVLPAPLLAGLFPGDLGFKSVICAAMAAAQAAYYLAVSEYYISSSVEAVALKARASAVADTYANQSARAGAILPFTSALAGLCAAASAAAVELLPLIHVVEVQSLISLVFPSGAALFAAAASVAKARCEIDSSAARLAASTGLTGDDKQKDPIQEVKEQIRITIVTTWGRIKTRLKQFTNIIKRRKIFFKIKQLLKLNKTSK